MTSTESFNTIFGSSRDSSEKRECARMKELKKSQLMEGYPIPADELDETTIGALFKLVKEMSSSEGRYYQLRTTALEHALFFERSRNEMAADLQILHTKMDMNPGQTAISPNNATAAKLMHQFMDITDSVWPASAHDALLAAQAWRRTFMIDALTECMFASIYSSRITDLLTEEQRNHIHTLYPGFSRSHLTSDIRPSLVRPIIEQWVDSGDLNTFPSDALYKLIVDMHAAW